MSVQSTKRAILAYIKANPGKSNREISEAVSVEISACVIFLHSLCLNGVIYRVSPTGVQPATYHPGARPMKEGPRG